MFYDVINQSSNQKVVCVSVRDFIKKNAPRGVTRGRASTLAQHHEDIKVLISTGYTLKQVSEYLVAERKVTQIKEAAICRYVKKHNLRNAK